MEEKNKTQVENKEQTQRAESESVKKTESDSTHYSHSYSHSHSHHHSHHHSNHSHHSSSHSNDKRRKFKRFVRKNRKNLIRSGIALAVLLLLIATAAIANEITIRNINDAGEERTVQTKNSISIQVPLYTDEVSLVYPAVTEYLKVHSSTVAGDFFDAYYNESITRLDVGLPVKLPYSLGGIADGVTVTNVEIMLSENSDLTGAKVYNLQGQNGTLEVHRLKTGTEYFYRITFELSNGGTTSNEGSFKTKQTPRILSVDGVYNLRDIGGWNTVDSKTIKQGLLYRGTEIDGAVEPKYTITSEGINVMRGEFGIYTDMDLRSSGEIKNSISPLGEGVYHKIYNAPMYADAFGSEGKASIRNIFADLTVKSNYPIYMHCTHGLDRTGIVCYLLGAILGMSDEDLMREYQLSSLYHNNLWALDDMYDFVEELGTYPGYTTQEKAQNYLLSAGVTQQEIENIKDIFID